MKYLVGDIGNTSTKVCILNEKFKMRYARYLSYPSQVKK